MPPKPVALVLRLPPTLHAALKRKAKAESRSLNNLLVIALRLYVKGGTP